MWRTRDRRDLNTYLKGKGDTNWPVIGLSVMATQASAITFLSTPGQGYEDGLGFVQNYFGASFALIIISAFFLPIYRRLKVYTAYEFLGQRFDKKTRLLGAVLFLLQRGLGAGITIYAPAIVLSTVMDWRLDATIICSGLVVIAYTVAGGSDAVSHTQKYQLGVIFAGMAAAFVVLMAKLHAQVSLPRCFYRSGRLPQARSASIFRSNLDKRYTFWSGSIGGLFLALSYFGTDQSQVQRYISGASLRESRLGLMFNAVFKIPDAVLHFAAGRFAFRVLSVQYAAHSSSTKPRGIWPSRATPTTNCNRWKDSSTRLTLPRKAPFAVGWTPSATAIPRLEATTRAAAMAAQDRSEAIREEAQKHDDQSCARFQSQRRRLCVHHLYTSRNCRMD